MKRRNSHHNRNSAPAETAGFFSWTHFAVTAIAALFLAIGLFFAASQHFSSMELGIKNAKLRSQLAELENEKRRLELSREIALTPSELKKNARSLGFRSAGEFVAVADKSETAVAETADRPTAIAEPAKLEQIRAAATTVPKPERASTAKKPEVKVAVDTRPRTVEPKASKPATRDEGSRPRIVVASVPSSKADPRKLVKKTVSSAPASRTPNAKLR